MKKIAQILAILVLAFLQTTILSAESLPIAQGERYYMTFVDERPMALHKKGTPLVVTKIFDYPWIEVEFSWTPQVQIDEAGNKVVPPKAVKYRYYLNLDRVISIKSYSKD